jgi:hypothetical protein
LRTPLPERPGPGSGAASAFASSLTGSADLGSGSQSTGGNSGSNTSASGIDIHSAARRANFGANSASVSARTIASAVTGSLGPGTGGMSGMGARPSALSPQPDHDDGFGGFGHAGFGASPFVRHASAADRDE